jgi:hypothetical protein
MSISAMGRAATSQGLLQQQGSQYLRPGPLLAHELWSHRVVDEVRHRMEASPCRDLPGSPPRQGDLPGRKRPDMLGHVSDGGTDRSRHLGALLAGPLQLVPWREYIINT